MNKQGLERVAHTGPPPGLKPWDRTLSFSDVRVFEECELAYKKRKNRERKAPREAHQIVGDLTHRGAAEGDSEAREQDLQRQLSRIPVEAREETEKLVRELIANADELDDGDEVQEQQKDKKLMTCDAPEPYWTLVAKPDETGMVDGERGRMVLQIVELKTSYRLKKKQKDQVFWAGMVAEVGRFLSYEGPKKLVIRLLRSKEEHVFWYSRSGTERNLRRVSAVIRRIEEAVANDDFKARTGFHCHSCPYRFNCDAYTEWSKTQEAQRSGQLVQLSVRTTQPAVGA